MQEPGRRPFAGVDLRRPKGYPAPSAEEAGEGEGQGDPCPRCESRDTKFCYYNNYNTSQPRHYCKSCRRYWTKGGTLRNVPVGGSSRKTSSSSRSSSSSPKRRRVAPAAPPEAEPGADTDVSPAVAAADAATTKEAAATEEVTADDPAAPPAADGDGGLALAFDDHPSVALGRGVADDAGGKELQDASPFEWPSGCDLGSYWVASVFADTDPALFLSPP